jgi:hypothetical protein
MPGLVSQAEYGRNYTTITKDLLKNSDLGRNKYGLSSTGLNWRNQKYEDDAQISTSHKFGKGTMQGTHPAWWPKKLETQYQDNFADPRKRVAPTYRETPLELETWKPSTRGSGFSTNHCQQDGKGWVPHPVLDGNLEIEVS